ncbi:hypothetical protein [Arenibaculum pallidiluteum]|uniref:hypothetical protein n=1 Tax=Arenibaculum pallidiluteum TaxID=2812559 RepID=UPI001A9677EB|nr:hypothetical protein [Arenibaculum pallidiluteum]
MDLADLVRLLAELTGLLSPIEGAAPDALERVRRLLASALARGQAEPIHAASDSGFPPPPIDTLPPELVDELRRIVDEAAAGSPDPSLRMARRLWPDPDAEPGTTTPIWTSGWAPEESIGPFATEDGGVVWFDAHRTVGNPDIIVDVATGRPVILLSRPALPPDSVSAGTTDFELPACTLWLAASAFDAEAPAGSFAGLRVQGGTVALSQAASVHGSVVTLAPGAVVTLRLQIAPPERRPSGAAGGDAPGASVTPPERADFSMTVGGEGRLVGAAPARLDAYGASVELNAEEGGGAEYDERIVRLRFPFAADRERFTIEDARSETFRPGGEAPIRQGFWALPVAFPQDGDPLNLGETAVPDALLLSLGEGLHAVSAPIGTPGPIRLDPVLLLVAPAALTLIADAHPARHRSVVELWSNEVVGRSRIELRIPGRMEIRFDATLEAGGTEALILSPLECRPMLDRPVTAAGAPVPFVSRRAVAGVLRLPGATRIALAGPAEPPRAPDGQPLPLPTASFALSNGFIRASGAAAMAMAGTIEEGLRLASGSLLYRFAFGFLVPMLPDPYAANMPRLPPRRLGNPTLIEREPPLFARVRWPSPAQAVLSFELGIEAEFALRLGFEPLGETPILEEPGRDRGRLAAVEARFPRASGQRSELFRLLDVSSRADLFGIGYGMHVPDLQGAAGSPAAPIRLRGLDVLAPVRNLSVFTLPAFQWEPVLDIPGEGALPFPPVLVSRTDGGPSRFATPTPDLVPVAPLPLVDALLAEYERPGGPGLAARFTLPFGMVAVAELRRPVLDLNQPLRLPPQFESVRPGFPASELAGGLQLSLRAGRAGPLDGSATGLPGAAVQTDNGTGGANVLRGGSIDTMFNDTFAGENPSVPIRRIDVSGYGASIFSDWRRAGDQATGITQVRFEAVTGRTSREVVQVRSMLYPWGARVVRIVTMERTGSGGVFRRDSGWQPASDAEYRLPGCTVHPGVVPRLANIRRIRDTSNTYQRVHPPGAGGGTVRLVQVLFDADVAVEGVTAGANGTRLVPAQDIVGYVQVAPVGADGSIVPLTAGQLDDLLATVGPVGGPVHCELDVAQSGLHMRLARIEVDRAGAPAGSPEFAAVGRGTIELPSAGQWTFAFRGSGETEARRLPPDRPIPLIRANPAGGSDPPYRFAEPRELHRPVDPETEYALLHSAGAHRMLIPRPEIRRGDAVVHGGAPLLFADMYTLSGGVALFPRAEQCHPLPAGSVLRITGRRKARLEIPDQAGLPPGAFKVGPLDRTLHQGAALRVRSAFRPDATVRLAIDSDRRPDWSCTFGPVSMIGDIDDLDGLVSVVADVSASADAAPHMVDPQMVFGGPLEPVQSILQLLTAFGIPFPIDVAVTNTVYGFQSGWRYVFPEFGFSAVEEAIEHGLGVMAELEILGRWGKESHDAKEIGKEISEHSLVSTKGTSKAALRGWHFVLEIEAKILVKVLEITPIAKGFAGGVFKFEVGGEEEGATKLSTFVGVAGAVKIELGVITLTGARSYSLGFRHLLGTKKVELGGASEWEVEGEFVKGLAAVAVSFELVALVEAHEDYHFKGEGTLAVDLTLGWVLSKTFEMEFEVDERIAIAVFVATTVLP